MRFEDEQYVRLYKRDTTTWKLLPWESRCILPLILRKVDRAGILELGDLELEDDPVDALSAHLDVPADVVRPGLAGLLKRKVLVQLEDGSIFWPRFSEGQEAKQSDRARQRAARERARDVAAAKARGVSSGGERSVTPRDGSSRHVTDRSDDVAAEALRDAASEAGSAPPDVTLRDDRSRHVTPPSRHVTICHKNADPVTLSSAQQSCDQQNKKDPPKPPAGGPGQVGLVDVGEPDRRQPTPKPTPEPRGAQTPRRAPRDPSPLPTPQAAPKTAAGANVDAARAHPDADRRPAGVPRSEWAMHESLFVEAYEQAVRDRTGNPRWSLGTRRVALRRVLETCCLGADRGDIEGWIRRSVSDLASFVEELPEDEERFWPDLDPGAMQRWFNRPKQTRQLEPSNDVTGANAPPAEEVVWAPPPPEAVAAMEALFATKEPRGADLFPPARGEIKV